MAVLTRNAIMSARGTFRSGSFTSSAMTVTVLNPTKAKKMMIFIAADWKRDAWNKVLAMENPKTVIPELMKDEAFKSNGQSALKYGQFLQKKLRDLAEILSTEEEYTAVKEAASYLSEAFEGAEIEVIKADESDHPKSANASPGKPAIFVE